MLRQRQPATVGPREAARDFYGFVVARYSLATPRRRRGPPDRCTNAYSAAAEALEFCNCVSRSCAIARTAVLLLGMARGAPPAAAAPPPGDQPQKTAPPRPSCSYTRLHAAPPATPRPRASRLRPLGASPGRRTACSRRPRRRAGRRPAAAPSLKPAPRTRNRTATSSCARTAANRCGARQSTTGTPATRPRASAAHGSSAAPACTSAAAMHARRARIVRQPAAALRTLAHSTVHGHWGSPSTCGQHFWSERQLSIVESRVFLPHRLHEYGARLRGTLRTTAGPCWNSANRVTRKPRGGAAKAVPRLSLQRPGTPPRRISRSPVLPRARLRRGPVGHTTSEGHTQ